MSDNHLDVAVALSQFKQSHYSCRLNFTIYFIFRPLTKSLGEVGFLHTDLWSNNLLKKDNKIIAIDFETAITGNLTICLVIIVVLIVMVL